MPSMALPRASGPAIRGRPFKDAASATGTREARPFTLCKPRPSVAATFKTSRSGAGF
jgi:hypothetical protein